MRQYLAMASMLWAASAWATPRGDKHSAGNAPEKMAAKVTTEVTAANTPAPTFIVWTGDQYQVPPYIGAKWDDGSWSRVSKETPLLEYTPRMGPDLPVVTTREPPPPLLEAQGRPPAENATWIPGFWFLATGQFVWLHGTWSAPKKNHVWLADEWIRQADGNYRWLPGRWVSLGKRDGD